MTQSCRPSASITCRTSASAHCTRRLYELLEPGGIFLNWEHVAAAGIGDGMLEEWMIEKAG